MVGGRGTQNERALIFVVLSHYPAFEHFQGELDQLLKIDDTLVNWDGYVDWYEQRVEDCDADCGNYLSDMMESIHAAFEKEPELLEHILEVCLNDDVMAVPYTERRDIVNALRRVFAGISPRPPEARPSHHGRIPAVQRSYLQ